jgi:hypothetical protein
MKQLGRILTVFAICVVFTFILSVHAHAYLDPGSGSYLLQILLASALAGLFALKVFFGKIKDFLSRVLAKFR